MIATKTRVQPHPDVVCTELQNGEAVLLHLGTQTYYSLNETGSFIWQLITDEQTLSEIGLSLATRYDVSAAKAQQSVITLVADLEKQQLVSLAGEQARTL